MTGDDESNNKTRHFESTDEYLGFLIRGCDKDQLLIGRFQRNDPPDFHGVLQDDDILGYRLCQQTNIRIRQGDRVLA